MMAPQKFMDLVCQHSVMQLVWETFLTMAGGDGDTPVCCRLYRPEPMHVFTLKFYLEVMEMTLS